MSKNETIRQHKTSTASFFPVLPLRALSLPFVTLVIRANPAFSGVTIDQYETVHLGMQFPAVVAILGKPTQERSSARSGDSEVVMYQWHDTSTIGNTSVTRKAYIKQFGVLT